MATGKPLVRSIQLTPLSHDHYEGLLFVWRIRQGITKNISLKIISAFINWFWEKHLATHFNEEERYLAPHLPADDILIKKMITDHETIRELIRRIDGNSLNDITTFATLLNDHIRFEERELFPYIERKLTQSELNEIRAHLDHTPSCSDKWPDEFWK